MRQTTTQRAGSSKIQRKSPRGVRSRTPKQPVELSKQQVNDILNALSFWISEYENVRGEAEETTLAMERLSKKFWAVVRRFK